MSFTSYLKFKKLLCHDENVVLRENRNIYCSTCNGHVLDVNAHLTLEVDFLISCQVAHYYARWCGDVNVPCRIKIINVPGIMPSEVIVPYSNLINAIELLKVANQEFIVRNNPLFDKKPTLQNKILEEFIKNYVKNVETLQYEDSDVQTIITAVLDQMKNMYEDKNIFKYYSDILCPYVKSCHPSQPVVKECTVMSPGEYFLALSQDAVEIRNIFGKLSIPFDVIYIMIYCYLCHTDLNLIANFTFDLIARICRGYFNDINKYGECTHKILNRCISYKHNTPLHFLIQCIRKGQVVNHVSQEFLEKYGELQQLVWNEFTKIVSTPNDQILKYAFSQSFPFIVFPNGPNYYGFMSMMGYLMKKINLKTGSFEKGTLANSKRIFKFVEMCTTKIAEFDKEGTQVLFWDMQVLKLFISSDESLIEQFTDILNLLNTQSVT